jgi:Zn-dependent alcohol dehydrogenase
MARLDSRSSWWGLAVSLRRGLHAARAVGAGPIIGVDVAEAKVDLALAHGATTS